MDHNPDAHAEIQELIDANNREQLKPILLTKTEMLCRVIGDGLSKEIKSRDRPAIFLMLFEQLNNLTQTLQIEEEVSTEAQKFLTQGPTLVKTES